VTFLRTREGLFDLLRSILQGRTPIAELQAYIEDRFENGELSGEISSDLPYFTQLDYYLSILDPFAAIKFRRGLNHWFLKQLTSEPSVSTSTMFALIEEFAAHIYHTSESIRSKNTIGNPRPPL